MGHRDVRGCQLQPTLTAMLLGARTDDDDGRVGGNRDVIGSADRAVRNELAAVVEVEHFGAHFLGVDVVERQRAGRATDKARVCDGVPTLPMPTTETLAETLADRLARPPAGATGSSPHHHGLSGPDWRRTRTSAPRCHPTRCCPAA